MKPARPSSRKPWLIHLLRIGLLIALAAPLRIMAERSTEATDAAGPPPLERIQSRLSAAVELSPVDARGAWWSVLDSDAEPIGLAAQTSPAGDSAIGYRGPSNVLLLADTEQQIVAADLIASRDTAEHVQAVTDSETFFDQFRGLRIGQSIEPVDAVSGATLTSYAIAEAVSLRLAGERPSLRFPRPLTAAEAGGAFNPSGDAASRSPSDRLPTAAPGSATSEGELIVRDAAGKPVGRLLRTGPLVDSRIGYQGPSEVLLILDAEDRVLDAQLRETYDNEPYVDYVRDEKYFWNHFRGRTLAELAALETAGIEGVSGATMTSQTVAETIQAAAERYLANQPAAANEASSSRLGSEQPWFEGGWFKQGWFAERWSALRWTAKDLVSLLFVVGAIALSSTRLRGIRWLRIVWQIALVVGFGWWTGNLLSQALVFGWAEQGAAWRLAPALAVVVGMAMLLPPLSKRNVYCHHLCPHGAAQQLLRGRLRWRWTPGPRATAALAVIPGLLLVAAYLLTLFGSEVPLAHWEPFDAYLWPVAAWGSVVLAVGSLAVAAVIPMGYCRFGCPTGRLLDYVRRTARSDRFTRRDAVVAALTIIGWLWVLNA